ncbi:MAG TPA: tRNA (5-methylaminomethyl-2-thiouridine)(34)-methyltransferase MnmD [Burkholderiaceae bacterium]|nr:tRNA (5-methylaminomethyl-2-thiouridine)(34)-methyltransferase MnmD [Burkholderiaceae bacterium]
MRAGHAPLRAGTLHFDSLGTPASLLYGDVYHARAGALAQAEHVFLRGNGLPERWEGKASFTVCETGFGLGNNFLALWLAWRRTQNRPHRLHVLSFEAHPFSREDLAQALAFHNGELRDMANALLSAWPPLLPGMHRLEFEGGRVSLTLAFGRVEYMSRQVEASVDAFFLDGFSPARNPAMWTRELFGQLVRIARPGATAATWCSAGQVRRDLSAAGFLVERIPGFSGKRQMSRAVLRPGLGRGRGPANSASVVVVGGGPAGAGVAHALAVRGHDVTVLDPAFHHGPAGLHAGHRCAAMSPALSRDDNPMSRLSRAGILLAGLRWKGFEDVTRRCGSLFRIEEEEAGLWQNFLSQWNIPPEWMQWCDAASTKQRCGLSLPAGGVWMEHGHLVRVPQLLEALFAHERVSMRAAKVARLERTGSGWRAVAEDGRHLAEAELVVLAGAAATPGLLARTLPQLRCPKLAQLQRMGGQVAYFHAGDVAAAKGVVAGAGYWLPDDRGIHVGGSTYELGVEQVEVTPQGGVAVAHKVAALLGTDPGPLLNAQAQPSGWAGLRVAVSDHLPVIGAATSDESLWMACAYGSRGLSWMTLAGEMIAARLNAEPMPVERELVKGVRLR